MRKRLKCIKCEIYYKDREDPEDRGFVFEKLCWNCRFIWKMHKIFIEALPEKINRDVIINLDGIQIRKKKRYTK